MSEEMNSSYENHLELTPLDPKELKFECPPNLE